MDEDEIFVHAVIDEMIEDVKSALKRGESLIISGLGKFYTTEYKERTVTGFNEKAVKIESRRSPRFKASNKLKKAIRG